MHGPADVQVGINLGFVQLSGTWRPNDAERMAAWELYVELLTRVGAVPLGADQGLLREALASIYSLFGSTREILRSHGPSVAEPKRNGEYSFGFLAIALLNATLRPLLTRWHPELEDWEAQRPPTTSRRQHERDWASGEQLRAELRVLRRELAGYADVLARACGVPDLYAAVPEP